MFYLAMGSNYIAYGLKWSQNIHHLYTGKSRGLLIKAED
jgi:hypothetical protein